MIVNKIYYLIVLYIILSASMCFSAEKDYQIAVAGLFEGSRLEVRVDKAGSRADVCTAIYAIEIEYPDKWYESIGQALYYALLTGLCPGIVLIQEEISDSVYLNRLLLVLDEFKLNITVWTIAKDFKLKLIRVGTIK